VFKYQLGFVSPVDLIAAAVFTLGLKLILELVGFNLLFFFINISIK
jgi:hypothetical protein